MKTNLQNSKYQIQNTNRGITLVALIITIIVLLILAMVSIRLVMNGGIIGRAERGTEAYTEAEVKEKIQLAYSELQMAQYSGDNLSETEFLRQRLEAQGLTGATVEVTNDGWNITYNGKEFTLSKTGTVAQVEPIDWDTVIANAQKHPEQSSTNNEIGIDMYGNPVNMDLWDIEYNETDKTCSTGKAMGSKRSVGYKGDIVDGKIIGEIPQYIKKSNDTYTMTALLYAFTDTQIISSPKIPKTITDMTYTFAGCNKLKNVQPIPDSVLNMYHSFGYCTSLVEAPKISCSVTDMSFTFYHCTSLTTAPQILNSVINMYNTFWECSSLTHAPIIPGSVVDMTQTFSGCISLIEAPTIPESVNKADFIFTRCKSLTGELIINALNIDTYVCCLSDAATNDGCNLVVSGTCPQLDDIIATKSENSHITKGQ